MLQPFCQNFSSFRCRFSSQILIFTLSVCFSASNVLYWALYESCIRRQSFWLIGECKKLICFYLLTDGCFIAGRSYFTVWIVAKVSTWIWFGFLLVISFIPLLAKRKSKLLQWFSEPWCQCKATKCISFWTFTCWNSETSWDSAGA